MKTPINSPSLYLVMLLLGLLAGKACSNKKQQSSETSIDTIYYGVDLSHWNGDIVEEIPKNPKITFVFCKATQGTQYVDPKFNFNWEWLGKSDKIKGAYHFYEYGANPEQQAQHFTKTIGELDSKDLSPVMDIEAGSLSGVEQVDTLKLQQDLLSFLREVEQITGRKPTIYVGLSFANQYLNSSEFTSYDLWLAEYTDTPAIPDTWKDKGYKFWQKSESYSLDTDKTDLDEYKGILTDIY